MDYGKQTRQAKARSLRYRKPIAKGLNLEEMNNSLCDIVSDCYDVQYYMDCEKEALIDALDGDEDETQEFGMMFSDLLYDCERLQEDLQNEYVPECFDIFFATVTGGDLFGWDSYEGDYFGLEDRYETADAREEARKKLERMTKDQLIDAACRNFRIIQQFLGVRYRYDCLKASLDIIKQENIGYLETVRRIEEQYSKVACDFPAYADVAAFENMVRKMPHEAWLQ